jgi:hypothetical protein
LEPAVAALDKVSMKPEGLDSRLLAAAQVAAAALLVAVATVAAAVSVRCSSFRSNQ